MVNKFYSIFSFLIVIMLFRDVSLYAKPSALQGRHFIVGFMENEISEGGLRVTNFYLSIFISLKETDSVFINIPGRKQESYLLLANQIHEIVVPQTFEVTTIGLSKDKLISIRSNSPMNVWAYSSKNQSSDSYVAIPVGIWGNEYRVVSTGNDMYNGRRRLEEE